MSRKYGIASVCVVLLLVVSILIVNRNDLDPPLDQHTADQGYPPPASPPVLTVTPNPDSNGIFAPPLGVSTITETISSSPQSALLVPIEAELAGRDTLALSEHFSNSQPVPLVAVSGEFASVYRDDIYDTLEALFSQDSTPVVQGYIAYGNSPDSCIDIITTGWKGPVSVAGGTTILVPLPGATITGTMVIPTQSSASIQDLLHSGGVMDEFDFPAIAWNACDLDGNIEIRQLNVGGFHDLVYSLYDAYAGREISNDGGIPVSYVQLIP